MQDLINQLNQIQADANSLYVKFHDYHWNIRGLHFFNVHAYTEEAYSSMSTLFDDAAEKALQLGGKAVTCQKALLEMAKAPKIHQECYSAKDIAHAMKDAYTYLREEFLKLRAIADKDDVFSIVAFSEDKITEFDKAIWMLKYTLDCTSDCAEPKGECKDEESCCSK